MRTYNTDVWPTYKDLIRIWKIVSGICEHGKEHEASIKDGELLN